MFLHCHEFSFQMHPYRGISLMWHTCFTFKVLLMLGATSQVIVLCRQTSHYKCLNVFFSVVSLFELLDLLPADFFRSHFTCSLADKVKCHIVNPAFMFSFLVLLFHSALHHPSTLIPTPPIPSLLALRCLRVATPQALAQAIKEAKEQHPDMSVTRVVVHKETELAEEEDWLTQVEKTKTNWW